MKITNDTQEPMNLRTYEPCSHSEIGYVFLTVSLCIRQGIYLYEGDAQAFENKKKTIVERRDADKENRYPISYVTKENFI